MGKKQKFYVVWSGRTPGIYTDWATCKAQVDGVAGAKYKSFPTRESAEQAYSGGPQTSGGKPAGGQGSGKSSGKSSGKDTGKGTARRGAGVKTYSATEVDAINASVKVFTDGGWR